MYAVLHERLAACSFMVFLHIFTVTQLMIIYTIFDSNNDPTILKITTPFSMRLRTLFCSCFSMLHPFQPFIYCTLPKGYSRSSLLIFLLSVCQVVALPLLARASTWSYLCLLNCSMDKNEEHFYKKILSI